MKILKVMEQREKLVNHGQLRPILKKVSSENQLQRNGKSRSQKVTMDFAHFFEFT